MTLNFELFIAKKTTKEEKGKKKISRPIIKIAKLSIVLGISVMIISVAIVTGFKSEITKKLTGFVAHIQITNYDNNSSFETLPVDKGIVNTDLIKQIPGVKHIQTFSTKPGILKSKKAIQGIILNGIGNDYDWRFFKQHLVAGEVFKLEEKTGNQILISKKLSDLLQVNTGDKISVYFIQKPLRERRFTISGIYNTGMDDFDKLFLVCDMRHIQKLNNWTEAQISGYEIFIDDFNQIESQTNLIKQATVNTFTSDGGSVKVQSIDRKYPHIFSWLEVLDLNVWVILFLMILVAGINMISGLLIIILEKTEMIGVLKTLGTANFPIRKIFLYHAILIIGKGMLWGNLIGLSLCFIQYHFKIIPLNPLNYYVDTVPIQLQLKHVILLNTGSLIASISMLLAPSYLITKISPVKAIRFNSP